MPPDPHQAFRRVAATFLARMKAQLVEQALTVPIAVAGKTGRNAQSSALDEVQRAAAAVAVLRQLPHYLADMLADSWRGPNARVLTSRERAAITEVFGSRARPESIRIVDGAGLRHCRRRFS